MPIANLVVLMPTGAIRRLVVGQLILAVSWPTWKSVELHVQHAQLERRKWRHGQRSASWRVGDGRESTAQREWDKSRPAAK